MTATGAHVSRRAGSRFGRRLRRPTERAKQDPPSAPELAPQPIPLDPQAGAASPSVEAAVLRATLVILGVLGAVTLVLALRGPLIITILALIAGAAMHGPVVALEQRGLPRMAAMIVVYGILLASFAVIVALVVPPLTDQVAALVAAAPALADEAGRRLAELLGLEPADLSIRGVLESIPLPPVSTGLILEVPLTAISIVANTFFVLFLSALMLLERDRAWRYAAGWFGVSRREPLRALVVASLGKLGAYVRGQLLIMSVTGIGSAAGMVLLGVPYPIAMGLLAFVTEAIPLVGFYLAAVPIVVLGFLESPQTGVLILIWIIAVQQLENLVLVPVIQATVVDLPPLVVLLAVLFGATLGGIAGALLAVPLAAVGQLVVEGVVAPAWRRRRSRGLGPRGRSEQVLT